MNEKNTDEMFRYLFSAVYYAALPDAEKQKLWKKAEEENPQTPVVQYFMNIKGAPLAAGLFDRLVLNL
jgi:hypothetical protein